MMDLWKTLVTPEWSIWQRELPWRCFCWRGSRVWERGRRRCSWRRERRRGSPIWWRRGQGRPGWWGWARAERSCPRRVRDLELPGSWTLTKIQLPSQAQPRVMPHICQFWYATAVRQNVWLLEHKTCDILAAERLRLMRFDNRLIIDSFQEAVCLLKW